MKPDLTQELLKSLVDYDPATGRFTWRKRTADMFTSIDACIAWNESNAAKPIGAFFTNQRGHTYIRVSILGKAYMLSRLIFFYMTGRWPVGDIMHRDRDGTNNAWSNLKEVSRIENMRSLAMTKRNSSGFVGVSWDRHKNKWHASIMVRYKTIHLGYFDDKLDAIAARSKANRDLGFDPLHGQRRRKSDNKQT
ncbi:HNH endonuclease [Methylotuvimicrobium sp. KM2]|uniref:HNH endonuclease n=1 Tax=Methylotuvimicrobium sp. KM2 TaxID=3133976 RepID=UPI003101A445